MVIFYQLVWKGIDVIHNDGERGLDRDHVLRVQLGMLLNTQ